MLMLITNVNSLVDGAAGELFDSSFGGREIGNLEWME